MSAMSELITYVQGYPVRKDGVTYAQILRAYGEDEKRIAELEDKLESMRYDNSLTVAELETRLATTLLKLEDYQSIGSTMLFRLLKNKCKNGEM